jgi:hypothetical protein
MAVMKDNIKFKKKIQKFNYPKDIDQELISLLDVINSIPGVRTLFSCCGHGKEEFYIMLAYTSSQTRSLIENIFLNNTHCIENFNDDLTYKDVFIGKFKSYDFYNGPINDNIIFENCVGYYNTELGLATKKERVKNYKKIIKILTRLVPNENW